MSTNEIDYNEIHRLLVEYHSSKWKKKKQQLLNIIVLTCMPVVQKVVFSIARRYSDPIEDITQIGSIGLIRAVHKYNPKYKNAKSYLFYCILWEIKHYYRNSALQQGASYATIEIAVRTNNFDIQDINEDIEPKQTEKDNQTKKIIEKRHIVSLDEVKFKDDNNSDTIENTIIYGDDKYNTNYYDELNSNKIILQKAIEKLSPKQQELIKKIYYEGYSQKKLAQKWNTKQSNISRIQKQAINLLQDIIKKEKITEEPKWK